MRRKEKWIGFDRRIELGWLDYAAGLVVDGAPGEEVKEGLMAFLQSLSYDPEETGSARPKTVRVILRIWGAPAPGLEGLHADCASLFPNASADGRMALHWAMSVAAYPFFLAHAELLGRLSALQGHASVPQVRRRIREEWGERETVERTSRYVLRSMVAWGVLDDREKGVYAAVRPARELSADVSAQVVRGILLGSGTEYLPVAQLMDHPAAFPFQLNLGLYELRRDPIFRVVSDHGREMVGVGGRGAADHVNS